MSFKEIITDIIIPLISGFIGGSIGSIIINKMTMNNKKSDFNNNGDVINGYKQERK